MEYEGCWMRFEGGDVVTHLFYKIQEGLGKLIKFPLAPMGVLAPGSAHARPSAQPPIDNSGNFPAHGRRRRISCVTRTNQR